MPWASYICVIRSVQERYKAITPNCIPWDENVIVYIFFAYTIQFYSIRVKWGGGNQHGYRKYVYIHCANSIKIV